MGPMLFLKGTGLVGPMCSSMDVDLWVLQCMWTCGSNLIYASVDVGYVAHPNHCLWLGFEICIQPSGLGSTTCFILSCLLHLFHDYVVLLILLPYGGNFCLSAYLCSDVFTSGIWSDLSTVQDPELQQLAKSLPNLVLQGRAISTVKKYSGAYNRWRIWADTKPEIGSTLPPLPIHIALYLNFLAQTAKTSSPIIEAVSALSWVNQIATVEDTTTHPLVVQLLAGIKKKLACATTKKEPVTPDILSTLVSRFGQQDASLADIRTLSICLLGFAGFFRFDELAKIGESDIVMYKEHMEIFIESSKTDQLRDGAWVVIARTGTPLCPVAMLERYMCMADMSGTQNRSLFRAIVNTKNGQKLRESGAISYTRVRELILEKLSAIGLDPKRFGLHSLRSGGASAAANAGVPDRMFKRHGRWRSENAKDGYVKDSLEERLLVSQKLGL